ncbi:MAG: sugar phosphate isomerase/epimerase [Pseudomonadota bacterium]
MSGATFDRRGFLVAAAGIALAAASPERLAAAAPQAPRRYPVGIQFFTFNTLASQGWEQFSAALELARKIGYDGVQLAGLMGHEPAKIRKRAEELGLALHSMHMGNDQVRAFRAPTGPFSDAQDAVYTPVGMVQVARVNLPLARDLGCEWGMIAASGPVNVSSLDNIRRMCDAMNKCQDVARQSGVKLSYHTHAGDFTPVDGQVPFDILVANTDAAIRFELDVCWVKAGGADPVRVIERHAKRIVSFHLKDIDREGKPATPGDGVLDFRAIHDAAAAVESPLFYVERDGSPGADLPTEASRGLKYLQPLGWGSAR